MSAKKILKPEKVKLFFGILYAKKNKKILDKAIVLLKKNYGIFSSTSNEYNFSKITHYYDEELGRNLFKRIYLCEKLIDRERIVDIKIYTIKMEEQFSINGKRTINIDPGYFSINNIVLVTTKNFTHRIYLREGIYAELTLMFRKHDIHELEWSYPDFKSATVKAFFIEQRAKLLNQMRTNNQKQIIS